jgi:DNA-binding NarL/FixJ family response regulator
MATDIQPIERRRMMLRRARTGGGGAGSFGGGSRVESLRDTAAEEDEVDDAINPDLNNEVRRMPPPMLPPPVSADEGRANPRARLNEVAMAGSPGYAKEHRLGMIHRLIMRGVSLDQIAQQLQVSISTIEKDRAELNKRLRANAKSLNIEELIGGQMAFYDEVKAMSLRVSSMNGDNAPPTAMKLAALRTALASQADMTRFLNTAGVFDALRFRRAEEEGELSDVQALMAQTLAMFQEAEAEEAEVKQPRKLVKRKRKPDGFGPMSFEDADASGSSQENVEL